MSTEIIKILDDIAKRFGVAIDWTSENIIPYLEKLVGKYVKYEIATSITWIVLFVFLFALTAIITKVTWGKARKSNFDDEDPITWISALSLVVSCVLALSCAIIICVQTMDIITCATFPEKMIYDILVRSVK